MHMSVWSHLLVLLLLLGPSAGLEDTEHSDEKLEAVARRSQAVVDAAGNEIPFVEYSGYLEEEEDGTDSNIHTATLDLAAAKDWCASSVECHGFTHIGEPTEEAVEYYFKSAWKLSLDESEAWTSYHKGETIRHSSHSEGQQDAAVGHKEVRCEIQTCSG